MKFLNTALLVATLFTASLVHADLKYIAYDLGSKKATDVTDTITTDVLRSDTYRTGSEMLFVQNDANSVEYYIGVFEVTVAQANKLGWTKATDSGVSYAVKGSATYDFENGHRLTNHAALSFPTLTQWQAYADDEAVKKRDNMWWGADWPVGLSDWYKYQTKKITLSFAANAANAHGVFDIYGNVAEYIPETKQFYGGFASGTCTSATKTTCHKASEISGAFLGARLIYTPPEEQQHTVTITLNGEPVDPLITSKPGKPVSFTEPTLPTGHDLISRTVTPEDLDITGTSFTMPEQDVTIAYLTAPYLTLEVVGGTATQTKVFEGDKVTFTPTIGKYQVFDSWQLPGGTAETETLEVTFGTATFEENAAGSTLTYTATVNTYPRVRVYGGTVAVNPSDADHGEGYYDPETILVLKASKVPGYKFKAWLDEDGSVYSSTDEAVVTVGDYNTSETYSPSYAIDETGAIENPEITRIGEVATASENDTVYSAKTVLGYKAGTTTEYTVDGNTFVHYDTELRTEPYVSFNTETVSIDYSDSEPAGSKTTAPTLKRVALDGAQPYYVGIYETTVAHYDMLDILQREKDLAEQEVTEETTEALESLKKEKEALLAQFSAEETADTCRKPKTCSTNASSVDVMEHSLFFKNIKTLFDADVTLPSVKQITDICADYETNSNGKIDSATIVNGNNLKDRNGDGQKNAWDYAPVGSLAKEPDKAYDAASYAFYDILGNVLDMFSDGTLRGGYCAIQPGLCRLNASADKFPNGDYTLPGAFRPTATVPAKIPVTIAGIVDNENAPVSLTVLPGQEIHLAPQVKAGKTFVGWTAKVGDTTTEIAKDAETGRYSYTVERAVTLAPTFSDEVPTITVSYVNCTGPESALPGSSTQIYATNPGYALKAITLEPANAGKVDVATGTITFASDATGEVKVTATYDTPKASGYILKLK